MAISRHRRLGPTPSPAPCTQDTELYALTPKFKSLAWISLHCLCDQILAVQQTAQTEHA